MELALYDPTYGYYMAAHPIFGTPGDYVTAPTLSPLFGTCIADFIAPQLQQITNPQIIELGAGNGALAATIIQQLTHLEQTVPYYILEISPALQKVQQAYLREQLTAEQFATVQWLQAPPQAPWQGILLGNEVLDAFAVTIFEKRDNNTIVEGLITVADQQLQWHFDTPITPGLIEAVQKLEKQLGAPFIPGYRSEICLKLPSWLNHYAAQLSQGSVLLIDYGFNQATYYHRTRTQGTLMCHQGHRSHTDPLWQPGTQDITAHVDFTAVANYLETLGFEARIFCPQAHFLLELDILNKALQDPNPKAIGALQCLLQPHEMGELFKVLALQKNISIPWSGKQFPL